jgi:hypothetical protein
MHLGEYISHISGEKVNIAARLGRLYSPTQAQGYPKDCGFCQNPWWLHGCKSQ